jgi:hypothetical protein
VFGADGGAMPQPDFMCNDGEGLVRLAVPKRRKAAGKVLEKDAKGSEVVAPPMTGRPLHIHGHAVRGD